MTRKHLVLALAGGLVLAAVAAVSAQFSNQRSSTHLPTERYWLFSGTHEVQTPDGHEERSSIFKIDTSNGRVWIYSEQQGEPDEEPMRDFVRIDVPGE